MRASDLYLLLQRRRGVRLVPFAALALAVVLAFWLGSAMAADPKDREQEQLRRLRAQVQQLQQSQSQAQEAALRAQGEKAALAAELQTLRAGDARQRQGAAETRQQVQALAQALATTVAERDELRSEADTSRELLLQLHGQLQQRETHLMQASQAAQAQGQNLAALAAEQNRLGQQLATCAGDNFNLVSINTELADRLAGTTLLGRAMASEPFFQLRRVQLENLAQAYRDRAAAHRLATPPAEHARATP